MTNRGLSGGSVRVSSSPASARKGPSETSSGGPAPQASTARPRPAAGKQPPDRDGSPARLAVGLPAASAAGRSARANEGPRQQPLTDNGLGIDDLIRRLVGQALAGADPTRSEPGCCDALFDVEVDGLRYRLVQSEAVHSSDPPCAAPLSPREHEIIRMVSLGYPNKTIAAVLEISSWTVNTYMRRIFAKLNVGSRAAMVAKVIKAGRIADNPPGAGRSPGVDR